jgi:benzoyl-CoA-dihydrodiol lyase
VPSRWLGVPSGPQGEYAKIKKATRMRGFAKTPDGHALGDQMITFDRTPESYKHWRLEIEGRVATLILNVAEEGGIAPGYRLKLNSYDLGVDIELSDALERIRFEHPQVAVVVITSALARTFSSGANIFMLANATHPDKVNFCKFTNETRLGIEDSSRDNGLKFLAALNGTTAGGGYEIALACDEILMVDDRSSTVSLPEVPLLGVLPGTGGLTRLVDKRKVRRDLADLFCTTAEGIRADRALAWNIVDHVARPSDFPALIKARAAALGGLSDRPSAARGIKWKPLERQIDDKGIYYPHLEVALDRQGRTARLSLKGPETAGPQSLAEIDALSDRGADWWPIAIARELNDALLLLRSNELELGLLVFATAGEIETVLAVDDVLWTHRGHWLVKETIGLLRRTLARLDQTSRSLYALIEPKSAFAGTLLELAFAADRSYMLTLAPGDPAQPKIALSRMNFGPYAMAGGRSRLATRFLGNEAHIDRLRQNIGKSLDARTALDLGLITLSPDDLDWEDEVRLAIEQRASLSPDALTAMEANLRFAGPESFASKIFGRLSAWQNWVFSRPNAVGETGALKVYGTGMRPEFRWERV